MNGFSIGMRAQAASDLLSRHKKPLRVTWYSMPDHDDRIDGKAW
jgi:hypothetical protein